MDLSDLIDLSNLSKKSIFDRVLVTIVKTSLFFGQVCFWTKYGNSGHGGLCRHHHGAPAATRSLIRRWLMTLVANGLASRGWGWLAKQTDTEDLTLLKLKLYYAANVFRETHNIMRTTCLFTHTCTANILVVSITIFYSVSFIIVIS